MSKKYKLKNLSTQIMVESEKVEILLEQIFFDEDIKPKINVLSEIALEKTKKLSKFNEKIGKLLNR